MTDQSDLTEFGGGFEAARRDEGNTPDGKPYQNPNWLYEKYWNEGYNLEEIGNIADVSGDTILRWMKKHNIDRRPTGGEVAPSKNEYIEALQAVANRLGRSPSKDEYKQLSCEEEPSVGAYSGLFETWNKAKKAAGLSPCSPGPDGFSDEDCVRILRRVANDIDKSPSQREFNNAVSDKVISAANIKYQFSTWNAAKKAAGLDVFEKQGWTKSDVIESICRVNNQHEGYLSRREYRDLKREIDPSINTAIRLFGSWNQALDAAGLSPQPDEYTEEECIEALQYVANKIGRSPTKREYRDHKRPADPVPWVMKNSFESWNEMKELADLYTYDDGTHIEYPYGSNWDGIAKQIRERDDHECRNCGLSSEEHIRIYSRDLDVHHLYKIMLFVEKLPDNIIEEMRSGDPLSESNRMDVQSVLKKANDPTNLVTLCKECHSQIENLPIVEQIQLLNVAPPEVQP